MTPRRKEADSVQMLGRECVVDYSSEVTDEQVRQAEELVRDEFARGNWVIVEEES